jgi:hypothetical protein
MSTDQSGQQGAAADPVAQVMEDLRKALGRAVADLNSHHQAQFSTAIQQAFAARDEPPADSAPCSRWRGGYVFLGVMTALLSVTVLLTWSSPMSMAAQLHGELRNTLIFLAFIVALASYLASVMRETVKRLGESSLSRQRRCRLGANLYWMATAEVPLVVIGLLTLVGLYVRGLEWSGNGWITDDRLLVFDQFLLTALGVLLLYMLGLHMRVWFLNRPWKSR